MIIKNIFRLNYLLALISFSILYGQDAVIGNNTYLPILVTGSNIAASGFYLSKNGNTFFVTAKHVLMNSQTALSTSSFTLTSYSSGKNGSDICILDIDLAGADSLHELRLHRTHDVAIVRIGVDTIINGTKQILFMSYVNAKTLPSKGIMTAKAITLFESTILSNDAFVLGYPGAIGVPNIPQLDYSQPLIRKGVVAGKNFRNKTVIIDCPTYPGNSGGPVLEVDNDGLNRTMRLIGIVSQFIPFEETWLNTRFKYENHQISNSGYCVVEPMDYIIELAK